MMPFREEYNMRVCIEAECVLESIISSANMYDYEKDLYLEDVIKEIRNRLKEKNGI